MARHEGPYGKVYMAHMKRAKGGGIKTTEAAEKEEEHDASTEDHFKRGGAMKRKSGGHVHGKGAEMRPDRRARGGSVSSPFSNAGKMSKMPFEKAQAGTNKDEGVGPDKD